MPPILYSMVIWKATSLSLHHHLFRSVCLRKIVCLQRKQEWHPLSMTEDKRVVDILLSPFSTCSLRPATSYLLTATCNNQVLLRLYFRFLSWVKTVMCQVRRRRPTLPQSRGKKKTPKSMPFMFVFLSLSSSSSSNNFFHPSPDLSSFFLSSLLLFIVYTPKPIYSKALLVPYLQLFLAHAVLVSSPPPSLERF